jgi:hypothetical protein
MDSVIRALTLVLLSTSSALCFASMGDTPTRDVDRGFYRGGGNGFGPRGNEQSDRPGRVDHGTITYGGNGCPNGTMQAIFAPDNLSFTILFDQFVADTTTAAGGRTDVMSCDAILPISIPAGQQMEITRVDYRGFANIPAGGKGMLLSTFNFAGRNGFGFGNGNGGGRNGNAGGGLGNGRDRINLHFNFNGPVADNYELSSGSMNNGRGMPQTEVSPCGGNVSLVIHNAVQVSAPNGQQAQLTVDSLDGSSNAVYYVNWRACRNNGPDFPHGGGSSR